MIKYSISRKVIKVSLIGIGTCIVVFILGNLILNTIATMEDPPLGNTIYIVIGSLLMFLSILGIFLILKYLYDHKKRRIRRERKRIGHKLSFLKDYDTKKHT